RLPEDDSFITGNGFAACCAHVLNYDGRLRSNPAGRPDWWFCKADAVDHFFAHHAPTTDFVFFTHNSDFSVGKEARRYLRRTELRAWFSTNVDYDHPKLHALPLGVANPGWPHGDTAPLRRLQADPPPKSRLFDVSFTIDTNREHRRYCL